MSPLAAELEATVAQERDAGRVGRHVTFMRLLGSWRALVEQVEMGYEDSVYEYANDVDSRSILGRVAESAPQRSSEALLAWLRPWDERYEAATVRAAAPFHGRPDPDSPYAASPWHWRIPRRLLGELKADLEDMGLA
jgi:hypothetical protein